MAKANRIRPMEARRAMRALLADPDDTEQAFRVVAALSGNSNTRLFRRFRKTAAGRRILAERRELSALLCDGERMGAMPAGSLGAAVRDFYAREQIDISGLVEASEAVVGGGRERRYGEDQKLFSERLRDLHDVWHVVTGYGRDLRGEAAVLSFTVPQTRNLGVAFIVATALYRVGFRSEMGRLIRQAFLRGRRAVWLPAQDWEALFEQPIDQVREVLRVGSPPVYEPVRSDGAPALSEAS